MSFHVYWSLSLACFVLSAIFALFFGVSEYQKRLPFEIVYTSGQTHKRTPSTSSKNVTDSQQSKNSNKLQTQYIEAPLHYLSLLMYFWSAWILLFSAAKHVTIFCMLIVYILIYISISSILRWLLIYQYLYIHCIYICR